MLSVLDCFIPLLNWKFSRGRNCALFLSLSAEAKYHTPGRHSHISSFQSHSGERAKTKKKKAPDYYFTSSRLTVDQED